MKVTNVCPPLLKLCPHAEGGKNLERGLKYYAPLPGKNLLSTLAYKDYNLIFIEQQQNEGPQTPGREGSLPPPPGVGILSPPARG